MGIHVKRVFHKSLIFLHKWLGVTLALLFLMWFVSGVVLYFVPFPGQTQVERLAGLQPLRLPADCCMTAEQAASKAQLTFSEARLGMQAQLPVWRLLGTPIDDAKAPPLWRAVDAQTGLLLPALSVAQAGAEAEVFSGRKALHTELLERDQWTVPQGLNPYRPLLRIEMNGEDGLELYVSPQSGEVLRDTQRAERFWNWLGAVPHWIYFTELRRYPDAWHNVIVWVSIPGVIMVVLGIVLGVWHLFLNRVRWIPYRQWWMRWHHISGLVAAIFTLTWIFSGLLSMNPFKVFSPRSALTAERAQWVGPKAVSQFNPGHALALSGDAVKEIELLNIAGQSWYRLRGEGQQTLVKADAPGNSKPELLSELPEATFKASLLALRADAQAADAVTLTRQDTYNDIYYARQNTANTRYTRPLPVWRVDWADGVTIYADPASARLLLRSDASNRWERVLYNGLHSFDFAPLLARPLLRDVLVMALSLLGTALCVTSCVIAWRVLVPRKRRGRKAIVQ